MIILQKIFIYIYPCDDWEEFQTFMTGTVGVYDSGIGGMTLLAECVRQAPWLDFCYYGDNENAPYGGKSKEELLFLSERVFDRFAEMNVSAAVVACNTVTTQCIGELRAKYSFPVIGTEPALRLARPCKRPLVLATEATLRSDEYQKLKAERKDDVVCFSPVSLVPEIEKNAPFFEKIGIGDHLPKVSCDGVVLGCTHYVYLKDRISRFYAAPCFDGNRGTARQLIKTLFALYGKAIDKDCRGTVRFEGNSKVVNEILFKQMFCF